MSIPRARLEIIKDDKLKKEFLLDQNIVGICREEENTVILSEANVSRYHAELNWNGDRYFITDLSSYCGTWVNQNKVDAQVPIPLAHGDIIRIGSFDVRFLTDVNVLLPQMPVNRQEATVFEPPTNSTAIALVTTTELGRNVAEDDCWQLLSEAQRQKLTDEEKNQHCQCLGKKVFQSCKFPGLKAKYDPAVDQLEPDKPNSPGDPPSDQRKLSEYRERVNKYNREIENWQNQYSDWKQKYQTAIGAAEGVIDKFYQDYREMFKVNIIKHWTALSLIILAMFGILLGVQKRKDTIYSKKRR